MERDSEPPLLPAESKVPRYHTHWSRWYILAVFSFFSFNQCLVWFTFSSVKKHKVKEYYGEHMTGDYLGTGRAQFSAALHTSYSEWHHPR